MGGMPTLADVTGRILAPVGTPTGPGVLDLLPRLAAALAGDGPALLPHPEDGEPAPSLLPGLPLAPDEDDAADPTAAVIATSGSTGSAKGVALPASALLASVSAGHDRLGGPGRWLLALPAWHVAGLQVLLRSLVARTEPVVLDLAGGFDPDRFAAAAAALSGPRRYTALVPAQLVRILDGGPDAVATLASFDAVLVGGQATPPRLRERAAAAGVRVVTTYGMSETCGGCVYDGVPLDGVRVRVETDETVPAANGPAVDAADDGRAAGRVWLGGPVLARGYRADPAATATAFRADGAGGRWFRTDDAGRLLSGGELEVTGRLDGVIVTGGLKVDPGAVESVLLRIPGVAEAAVFGVDDARWGQRVAAAVVLEPGAHVDADLARARVGAELAGHAAPRQLLVLDRLPLRGPGKPDRDALARMAAAAGASTKPDRDALATMARAAEPGVEG